MQRQLGRKKVLNEAANEFNDFLNLLNNYQLLSKEDSRLYTTYRENPFDFSTAPQQDAAARRNVKIARFREEKQIKQKIEQLQVALRSANVDDEVTRNLYLTDIQLSTSRAFQNLESIGLEIQVLAHAPTEQPSNIQTEPSDGREKIRTRADGYSDRLDRPQNGLAKGGPILSKDGKPLQPFTLLSSRDRVRKGVFRPGHNLPTMSIDEYLEEEKRRGGIIEGGGPQSEIQAEIDEDDMDKADEETMKARDWDEFTEANHKGSGNTINRG
ncbi:MAG: hypothetical protein M1814_006094 [Vezdaea aestivalis]|nr:MAG: hypothetical protein M1814_006094 [Vezdaea aestivalis]